MPESQQQSRMRESLECALLLIYADASVRLLVDDSACSEVIGNLCTIEVKRNYRCKMSVRFVFWHVIVLIAVKF